MQLRPYRPEDAVALAELFQRAVREIGARDYSPAQIDAWAGGAVERRAESLHARLGDGRLVLVAVDEGGAARAFGDLEPDGHIDFLYADPGVAGKGIAAALYDALEAKARQRGIARLYSEASEAARRFFLKKGFRVLHRRDFEVAGVPIHNYLVEKQL
jgi:putative acetyltransferase